MFYIIMRKKLKWFSNLSADDSNKAKTDTMTTKMTKAQLQDRVKELERHLRTLENKTCGLESQIAAFQEKNERYESYKRYLEKENRELKIKNGLLGGNVNHEKFREEHGCAQQ